MGTRERSICVRVLHGRSEIQQRHEMYGRTATISTIRFDAGDSLLPSKGLRASNRRILMPTIQDRKETRCSVNNGNVNKLCTLRGNPDKPRRRSLPATSTLGEESSSDALSAKRLKSQRTKPQRQLKGSADLLLNSSNEFD